MALVSSTRWYVEEYIEDGKMHQPHEPAMLQSQGGVIASLAIPDRAGNPVPAVPT